MRKIILLQDLLPNRTPKEPISQAYAFWLNVDPSLQAFYAKPAFKSVVVDANQEELDALISGAFTEEASTMNLPEGSTFQDLQARLVEQYVKRQAEVDAYNPWTHYGDFWDGQTWSVKK